MWRVVWLVTVCSCVDTSSIECANGVTCGFDTICDDVHGGCIVQEQLDQCLGLGNGISCTTEITGPGVCDAGVCLGQRCGDGYRAPEEICDGNELGMITSCEQLGFYDDVAVTCTSDCQLETSMCTGFCGDEAINGREQCDGSPPTNGCIGFGFGTGVIDCVAETCAADLTGCIPFGWREIPLPAAVRAIGGTSDTNIWVAGDGGMVQRFDGTTWSPVDVSTCVLGSLTSIIPIDATDAVLLDDASTDGVIRVNATGCSRTTLGPVTDRIHGIWATSLTNIYAVEDDNTTGVRRFDGTTWSLDNAVRARFIWGSGPNDIYTGSIFRSDVQHFSNGTWSSVAVPGVSSVWGIWGTNADNVYVGAANASDHALVSRYQPSTGWTPSPAEIPNLSSTSSTVGSGSAHGDRVTVIGTTSLQPPVVLASDGTGWANLGLELDLGGATYTTPSGALYVAALGQPRIFLFEGTTRPSSSSVPNPVTVYGVGTGSAIATVRTASNPSLSIRAWDGTSWVAESNAVTNVNGVMVDPSGNVFVSSLTATGIRRRTAPNTYVDVANIQGIRIAGTSPTDLWVITSSLAGTVTHWDGITGRADNTLLTELDYVLALTPTLAFAVSASGAMSQFNGSTWSAITSPLTARALGVTRTSASEGWAWHATQIAHFANGTWASFGSPPGESAVRSVWGTSNALFVAGGNGLHYFNGQDWMRVDTGGALDVRSIDGRGDSIFYSTATTIQQLYRTRVW